MTSAEKKFRRIKRNAEIANSRIRCAKTNDPYIGGHDSFNAGFPLDANPWVDKSGVAIQPQCDEWAQGWEAAREEKR